MAKLVNVGNVAVEDNEDEVTTATLGGVMDESNPLPEATAAASTANSASDDAAQEAAEDEALANTGANISEKDKKRQLEREKKAFKKKIGDLGEDYGAGKVSMIVFAEQVTEAAMAGSIGPKDAEWVYDDFTNRANDRATLDGATSAVPDVALSANPDKEVIKSKDQQVSKVRQFIKLGNEFEDDAAKIMRAARNVHLKMVGSVDRAAIMKGSTYTIMKAVASEQMTKARKGAPMTEAEIETYLSVDVPEKVAPTGLDKLEASIANARAAINGSTTTGRAPLINANLDIALEHLRAALGELAPARLTALDAKGNKGAEANLNP